MVEEAEIEQLVQLMGKRRASRTLEGERRDCEITKITDITRITEYNKRRSRRRVSGTAVLLTERKKDEILRK